MNNVLRKCTSVLLSALLCLSFAMMPAYAAGSAGDAAPAADGAAAVTQGEEALASDYVTFVYVESSEVVEGSSQNVVVGVSEAAASADSFDLVYSDVSGNLACVPASNVVEGAALFSIDSLVAGAYRVEGMGFTESGVRKYVSFAALDGVECSFAVASARDGQMQAPVEQGDVSAYFADGETGQVQSTGDMQMFALGADADNSAIVSSVVSHVTGSTARAADVPATGKILVAIDPGHGGPDPGACANGLKESELTWQIALACKSALEGYGRYEVMLTRTQDENPKQSERVRRAAEAGAALFVSIHINSADAASAKGAEVWIPNAHGYLNNQTHGVSKTVASEILSRLSALGLSNRGLKIKDATDDDVYDDGSKADYFTVISEARRAGIPAMIVEHAFITNAADAERLASPEFLKQLGQADAAGIADTFYFAKPQLVLSADMVKPGGTITMSVKGTQGNVSGLKYNFAYKTANDWSIWDSTVKQTGSYTSETAYSFKVPEVPGQYTAWVNVQGPDGVEQSTFDMKFLVSEDALDWTAYGTVAPEVIALGQDITFSSDASGADASKLTYNYAWSYEGGWDEWDSTIKSTGATTSEKSATFTPSKTGDYHVWVDVMDPSGRKLTTETAIVRVEDLNWTATSTVAPRSGKVGQPIEFSAQVTGTGLTALTYNYAWSYEGGWDEWSSTVKSTGKPTADRSGTFTPTRPGTYHLWVDVMDPTGRKVTTSTFMVQVNSLDWTAARTVAPKSGKIGQPIVFSADVSGSDVSDLSYSYAWSYGGGWDEWGSTFKSTGSMTKEESGSFTPSKAGTYVLWVDVKDSTGRTVTTSDAYVEVNALDWIAPSIKAPATGKIGQPIEFSVNTCGTDVAELRYSYAWSYEGGWDLWDSTIKSTGSMTKATSATFTPTKAGTYHLWADVKDSTGRSVTVRTATVLVKDLQWTATETVAPATGRVGQPVMFATNAAGEDSDQLTYNYVWRYGTTWANWDSTIKSTGKATADTTASFTPAKAGTYYLWVDVYDPFGRTVTTSTIKYEAVGEPIMGSSQTTVDQMVRAYSKAGRTYPSSVYASLGAPTIRDFCTLIYEEARAEGVRAEVLFAQVMHETGWLRFGGDVKPEQCNFGGLGATGGGNPGETFPNVRTGLRAQTQHLKAYGSTAPLVNACVDTRFHYVKRGCAPFVEDLAGTWAADKLYGTKLVTSIKALLRS